MLDAMWSPDLLSGEGGQILDDSIAITKEEDSFWTPGSIGEVEAPEDDMETEANSFNCFLCQENFLLGKGREEAGKGDYRNHLDRVHKVQRNREWIIQNSIRGAAHKNNRYKYRPMGKEIIEDMILNQRGNRKDENEPVSFVEEVIDNIIMDENDGGHVTLSNPIGDQSVPNKEDVIIEEYDGGEVTKYIISNEENKEKSALGKSLAEDNMEDIPLNKCSKGDVIMEEPVKDTVTENKNYHADGPEEATQLESIEEENIEGNILSDCFKLNVAMEKSDQEVIKEKVISNENYSKKPTIGKSIGKNYKEDKSLNKYGSYEEEESDGEIIVKAILTSVIFDSIQFNGDVRKASSTPEVVSKKDDKLSEAQVTIKSKHVPENNSYKVRHCEIKLKNNTRKLSKEFKKHFKEAKGTDIEIKSEEESTCTEISSLRKVSQSSGTEKESASEKNEKKAWYDGNMFTCNDCAFASSSLDKFKKHVKSQHGVNSLAKFSGHFSKTEIQYECQICQSFVYHERKTIQDHVKTHFLTFTDYYRLYGRMTSRKEKTGTNEAENNKKDILKKYNVKTHGDENANFDEENTFQGGKVCDDLDSMNVLQETKKMKLAKCPSVQAKENISFKCNNEDSFEDLYVYACPIEDCHFAINYQGIKGGLAAKHCTDAHSLKPSQVRQGGKKWKKLTIDSQMQLMHQDQGDYTMKV